MFSCRTERIESSQARAIHTEVIRMLWKYFGKGSARLRTDLEKVHTGVKRGERKEGDRSCWS